MGECRITSGLLVGLTCLLAMFCLPAHALALGFGTLGLNSHLNEPLNAQVQLLLNDSEQIDRIKVELASSAEYSQMGVARQEQLSLLRLVIEGKSTGSPVVRLYSSTAITTPILSIILKAQKEGRGTYYRHYQLLMDAVETMSLNDRIPKVLPVSSAQQPVSMDRQSPVTDSRGSDWTRSWRYGPVRAGDSLSEIAYRLRKDKRYSNNQVMLSLYEQNPDSFVGGSINHLKQGSWLNIPTGEVVKSYAGKDAMARLNVLLKHVPAEEKSAVAQAKGAASSPAEQENQELRYSGKINMSSGAGDELAREILNAVRKESDEKLETIHQQLMAGKLQMSGMNQTVARLDLSMQGIKQDVKSIKDDVNVLKLQAQSTANGSDNYWLMIVLALLAALLGLIAGLLLRRPKKGESEADNARQPEKKAARPVKVKKASKPVEPEKAAAKTAIPFPSAPNPVMQSRPSDAVDTLVNKIEESLGQCRFEDAEALLDEVDPLAPDSLRAAVLRAQLYHETGRQDECQALMNRMSEASDKKRWESFCHMLPSHVWQACFSDGTTDNG